MNAPKLKFFSDPHVLRQIGRPLLTKFFDSFAHLLPSKYFLPSPRPDNEHYFDSLAQVLERTDELPDGLAGALLEIEALAAPENLALLQATLGNGVEHPDAAPLSQAIRSWLGAQSEPKVSLSSSLSAHPVSSIQHPEESTIHHPESPPTETPKHGGTEPPPSPPPVPAVGVHPASTIQYPDSPTTFAPPPPASSIQESSIQHTESPPTEPPPSPPPVPAVGVHPASSIQHPESTIHHPASQENAPRSPAPDVQTPFLAPEPEPWPEPVNLTALLDRLVELLKRFVVLPKWAAETLALWILHTYAFHLRDVTTYIGIESPEPRCGKTTLLSLLNELANRAIASSNISPPAFFRVIEDLSPTLLIDEVDTFLAGNDQLRGILNAGYHKKTAFVLRAAPSPASNGEAGAENPTSPGAVKRYSCWCPKVLAKIGRFPDTLADRCIIIRMHRKTSKEQCDRSRELDAQPLKRQCLRFVADHASEIASAKPQIPPELNDRAADIWEPLLVLADLAGDHWPDTARKAALSLSASAQEASPIASLLIDIFILFAEAHADRMFTQSLIVGLTAFGSRPWSETTKLKVLTDTWLAQQLRPYGIKPRTLRIGDKVLKGYLRDDLMEAFQRYVPKSTLQAFLDEHTAAPPQDSGESNPKPDDPSA